MRRWLRQFLVLGLFAAGGASAAQTLPVQDWTPETVVVNATRHGPLFWRIARGSGEVWILGVVGAMPDGLDWDHTQLDGLLDGAKAVLLQPRLEVGAFEGAWFFLTQRDTLELSNDAHLEEVLNEPLKTRFVQTRTKLDRDAGRYEDYVPAWAAIMIYGDFLRAEKFAANEPNHTIERLADHKDVPVRPIATYDPLSAVKQIGKMSDAASQTCLRDALDDIDIERVHQVEAARAWAAGDLAGMKRNYSEPTLIACLLTVPGIAELWDKSVADTTKAVNEALDGGGRTVMVASLGTLLRKDGILERLRAEGATVDSPQ